MREILTFKFKQKKRRAIELYSADSPFKGRAHKDRTKEAYRKPKHVNKWKEEL